MDEAIASSRLDWLLPQADSLGDFVFFRPILSYLRNAVADFGIELMGRSMQWVGGIALTLLTLWILVQGYRIVTGQSRSSMMALVTHSLRAVLILTAATTMAMFGSDLHEFLNEDVRDAIHHVVTGEDESPEENIDQTLAWMQVAFSSIDSLDVMGDPVLDKEKTQALWFVGLGTGGPAITAGTMLLLYEIALALFIGFGPLFILCLLFDQTKPLFEKWLLYGIGTLFSMAVLSAMVSIALEMVVRVAAAFWGTALAGSLLGSDFTDGMTSVAMQQGGMGLILTLLIISTPPMAAAFFNGALGQFMPFSAFGGGGTSRRSVSGDSGGYADSQPEASYEFQSAMHQFRYMPPADIELDQIKGQHLSNELSPSGRAGSFNAIADANDATRSAAIAETGTAQVAGGGMHGDDFNAWLFDLGRTNYLRDNPQVLAAIRTQQLAFEAGLITGPLARNNFQIENRAGFTMALTDNPDELARRLDSGLKSALLGTDEALLQQARNPQVVLTAQQQADVTTALHNRLMMAGVRENDPALAGLPIGQRIEMLKGTDAGLRERLVERSTELLEISARELTLRQAMHSDLTQGVDGDVHAVYRDTNGIRRQIQFDSAENVAYAARAIGVSQEEALAKIDWSLYEASLYAAANTEGITQVQFNGAWRPRPNTMRDYRDSLEHGSPERREYDRWFGASGLPQGYNWSRLHTEGIGMDIRQLNGVDLSQTSVVEEQVQFLRQLRAFNNGEAVARIIAPNELYGIQRENPVTTDGFVRNMRQSDVENRHLDHIHYGL